MRSEPTLDKPHQYLKRHSIEDTVETSEALFESLSQTLKLMQCYHLCSYGIAVILSMMASVLSIIDASDQ
jgi:hypothetical protein